MDKFSGLLIVAGIVSLVRSDILGIFLGVELMLNGIALVSVGAVGMRIARHVREERADG